MELLPFTRKLMKIFRVWPDERFSLLPFWMSLILATAPIALFIRNNKDEPVLYYSGICQFIPASTNIIKLFYIYWNKSNFRNLIEKIESSYQKTLENRPEEWSYFYSKMVRTQNYIQRIFFWYYVVSGIFGYSSFFWTTFKLYVLQCDTEISLLMAVDYGWGISKNAIGIEHLISILSGIICIIQTLILETVTTCLIIYVSQYFVFVRLRLSDWNKDIREQSIEFLYKNADKNLQSLRKPVEEHCNALELFNDFNNFIDPIILLHIIASIGSLCLVIFLIFIMANNWSLRLAVVYCGIIQLISLLILTYASSNLIYNIERIGLIIGTFDWYNHPPRVRRALLLIMNAGQKYRAITAGRFYPVTLAVFEMILKSSISYYTILKNMYT